MNIDEIITQIQSNQGVFKIVAGAAQYEALPNEVNPQFLPALYVIPLGDEAEELVGQNWSRQIVKERVSCVMVLDNRADRRGQTAAQTVESMKYLLYSLLYTFRPPSNFSRSPRGLYLVGGELRYQDFARIEWEITFGLDTWISTADGWQLTGPAVPSIEITTTTYNAGGEIVPKTAQ